jgi:hypothetical protein
VSNVLVPTGSLLAERLLYLPSVGFLLGAGAVVARGFGDGASRSRVLIGVVVLLALAGVARSA